MPSSIKFENPLDIAAEIMDNEDTADERTTTSGSTIGKIVVKRFSGGVYGDFSIVEILDNSTFQMTNKVASNRVTGTVGHSTQGISW